MAGYKKERTGKGREGSREARGGGDKGRGMWITGEAKKQRIRRKGKPKFKSG